MREACIPHVSVIVTSYNQSRYIEQAIQSILQQSYHNFEIIVVDDGSTDGTLGLLQKFQQQYPKKIYLHTHPGHANRGIVATYQLGLRHAKAPLIAFLEADDAWTKNYLMEKVRIFETHPHVGVVFSPCKFHLEGWYGFDMVFRQTILQWLQPKGKPFCNFSLLLRKNNVATFSTFMVRAKLLASLDVPNDTNLVFYDWWVLMHLSIHTSFYFDNRSYCWWRHSRKSLMGKQKFFHHKIQLTIFYNMLYDNIELYRNELDFFQYKKFQKKQKALPHFIHYYDTPSIVDFILLAKHDPCWAFETVVSYMVNAMKFS